MQIVTQNLTYIYSEKSRDLSVRALDNVTLTINEGDFFGIIGHTGSGKTTFVQHLNGLIRLGKNKGSIVIGDFNLADKKCAFKDLRAKVGMVFQYPEYQLFAETVYDDVAFGVKNFFPDIDKNQLQERVRSAIQTVGLDFETVKNKSPFELSGGQKRRVAIAGVIASKPEVLVLDEPVAGLDPKGKRDFIKLLHDLHASFVKTIIIVSHDMDLVAENCNRVGVFAKGKLKAVGTPKQLFSDYESVESAGIYLPLTASLTKLLKDKGVEIDSDFTERGFIDGVVKAFGNRGDGQ